MTDGLTTPPMNWVLFPITRATSYLLDEARIGSLLRFSVSLVENSQAYFTFVETAAKRSGNQASAAAATALRSEAPTQQAWAAQLRQSDFEVLNSHALVSCWSAVETCIEDLVIDVLLFGGAPEKLLSPLSLSQDVGHALTESTARRLARKLEGRLRVSNDTPASMQAVLTHIELPISFSHDAHRLLREADALRNCILHRAGIIDALAVASAPSLSAQLGTRCAISSNAFLHYHSAMSELLVALHETAVRSRYITRITT